MNKRITSILLAVLMVMSTLVTAVPTNAAGGAPNVAFEIDAASEINPGDTFTVTLRNVRMAVNSFACGIAFDAEKLEWVSTVSGTDIGTEDYDPDYYGLKKVKGSNKNGWYTELTTSSAAEIAANEAVGFTAGAGSTDIEYYEGIIAIITFKAKDVAGEAELTIYESSASDDTVNGDGYNGKDGFETKKVTITAAHVCAPVIVEAKAATCEDDGNIAYYECDCGKYYEDADATKEITDKTSVVVPAFDHDWDDGVVTTDPTETDAGVKTYTCQNDNSHTYTEEVPALGHQCSLHLTPVDAEDATCEDDGNIAHYVCDCGKLYKDTDATKELTTKDVVIKAGHEWGKWVVTVEATTEAAGEERRDCSECDEYETREIPKLEDNKFWDTWYWTMMMIYNQIFEIEADATEGGEIDPYGITKVRFSRDVKYTITPAEGYEIEAVYVDGKDIGAVDSYTFKNVSKDHSIYAVFAKIEKEPIYADIDTDDWFYDDVVYVTENGLMNGTGNGKFSPYVSTTRAMIVTILWRLEGEVSAKSAGFTDVADGMWYTEAIDWAAANGIVNGYGDGTFGPEKNITREQIMAIFHRYAAYKGWDDGVAVSMIAQYDCSVWAENDVNWADMNGILAGLGVDINDMTAEADRAEIAAYFTRFCLNVAK